MKDVRIPLADWKKALKPAIVRDNWGLFVESFAIEVARGKTHFVASTCDVRKSYLAKLKKKEVKS